MKNEYDAVCIDYPEIFDDYGRIAVRIENAFIEENSNINLKLNAYLYDYHNRIGVMRPGDRLVFSGTLLSVTDERYSNGDTFLSKDFYLRGTLNGDVRLVRSDSVSIKYLPVIIRNEIAKCCKEVFSVDTSSFFIALLTGNKEELYKDGNLYYYFSKSGFVHIVAVSGMHISYLVGFCQLLLGKSRKSSVICITLLWMFILVTGSPPSAVRAGIMQSIILMAPLLLRENDTLTSLALAASIILLINPYEIYSPGFLLSFSATLGISLFSEPLNSYIMSSITNENKYGGIRRALLKYPVAVISSSVSVMFFSIPVVVLMYGELNILSPLTNMLALWIVPICFCGGAVICGLKFILPSIAIILGKIPAFFAGILFFICRTVSGIPYSTVYFELKDAFLLIALGYLILLIIHFSKNSIRFKLVTASLSIAGIVFAFFMYSFMYSKIGDIILTVIDVSQGECVLASSGDRAIMVDCGSADYSVDSAESALEHMNSRGLFDLDVLILSHLHEDHVNGAVKMMELSNVDTIVLPEKNDNNMVLFDEITTAANREGTKIIIVSKSCRLSIGEMSVYLFPDESASAKDDNETCLVVRIEKNDFSAYIMGDSPVEREMKLIENLHMGETDVLIVGHHGSKTSTSTDFLNKINCRVAVIPVGKNTYGHPHFSVLERLRNNGCAIFRTDLNGDVEIRHVNSMLASHVIDK